MKLFTSDWNSNPCDKDLNPAKTHDFQLRSQTWFQDLKKLRFLTSHYRKNSVRDKVIGKMWIYSERNAFHRQSVGHRRGRVQP